MCQHAYKHMMDTSSVFLTDKKPWTKSTDTTKIKQPVDILIQQQFLQLESTKIDFSRVLISLLLNSLDVLHTTEVVNPLDRISWHAKVNLWNLELPIDFNII